MIVIRFLLSNNWKTGDVSKRFATSQPFETAIKLKSINDIFVFEYGIINEILLVAYVEEKME